MMIIVIIIIIIIIISVVIIIIITIIIMVMMMIITIITVVHNGIMMVAFLAGSISGPVWQTVTGEIQVKPNGLQFTQWKPMFGEIHHCVNPFTVYTMFGKSQCSQTVPWDPVMKPMW